MQYPSILAILHGTAKGAMTPFRRTEDRFAIVFIGEELRVSSDGLRAGPSLRTAKTIP
jgi:hypothetical protein